MPPTANSPEDLHDAAKFAANLSMMFQEIGFLDRFDAAARCRLQGGRVPVPLRSSARGDRRAARTQPPDAGLVQHAARRLGGGRARPRRAARARGRNSAPASTTRSLYAKATKCRLRPCDGRAVAGGPRQAPRASASISTICARPPTGSPPQGITAIIEPINTRDIPGYFLNYDGAGDARSSSRSAGPTCNLQLDLYHVQIMEGDLAHQDPRARRPLPACPDRRQPGPARARYRRNQLSLPVRPVRRDRLCRLDRLRIPAEGRHARRARLGQAYGIRRRGSGGHAHRHHRRLRLSRAAGGDPAAGARDRGSARSTSWCCSTTPRRRCRCPRTGASRWSPATSPIATRCARLIAPGTDAVFHLAADRQRPGRGRHRSRLPGQSRRHPRRARRLPGARHARRASSSPARLRSMAARCRPRSATTRR